MPSMHFDFYYGAEAEQFAFFRIPQLLIKDRRFKCLSTDAKLLYGLMLDRMTLSMKNGWLDAQNRAYIYYSMESIMEDLGCANQKWQQFRKTELLCSGHCFAFRNARCLLKIHSGTPSAASASGCPAVSA